MQIYGAADSARIAAVSDGVRWKRDWAAANWGWSSRKSFVARNNELACVLNPDEVQNEIDDFSKERENTVDPFQKTIS